MTQIIALTDLAAERRAIAAALPLPTPAQLDRVARVLLASLQGTATPRDYTPPRPVVTAPSPVMEAKNLAARILACDVCDLPPEAHTAQGSYGTGFHDWVPGRAQQVLTEGGTK
jgi:hypothetical protein